MSKKKLPSVPLVFVVALMTVGLIMATVIVDLGTRNDALEEHVADLERRLRDAKAPRCPDVLVTCECPDYEEGWEDAEFAEGCDPDPIGIDELRAMCSELEAYGYVPDC